MAEEEPTYGPVITAINEGHFEHDGKCAKCKTKWECSVIKGAKAGQRAYGEQLAQRIRTRFDVTRLGVKK